ncbi:lectin-like [Labeo rohita]|uniref:lectin-like n=1 Tax=Labeo rohita TaxID=84645 RepID=UPI0021E2B02E|nr:lectin-like [Labeo rohita]
MFKSGSTSVLLLTLLFESGNFLIMKRGFAAGRTNVTVRCPKPTSCNVDGFEKHWYKMDNYCVRYYNQPLNFSDAEFSCREKAPGAHLVSVHNKKHNEILLDIVKKFNPNNLRIWLGAFELFQSGKFLWLDGSFWDYEIWTTGEPTNIYNSKEECLEMNWKETGRWNDDACSYKKNYICAFKIPS